MTATPPPDPYREWDAAYVLGALSPRDRRAFEQHLATCPACREAVGELAGMPGILGMLTAEHADALVDGATDASVRGDAREVSDGVVVPLAVVAAGARRRQVRRRALLGAAAVGLVLAGVAGGVAVTRPDDAPPPVAAGTTEVALEPVGATDVRADLTLTSAAWGTRLDWSCSYPVGKWVDGATYQLVLVDDAGTREVVATWSSTKAGSSDGLGASSAVPVDGIARLELGVVGVDGALAAADV
ncbi:zf-HC2 domain-containing protein [Cellulosimicrobium cellulans]|uniref:zf-HC2 domain-containing protein n=1 Tax=Cellulosimicrobium cellulans TaxID=1710 RepID=UPI001EDBA89C|nr:zf-HC2 domain-containing protein [Cellulosimicrobium cellulans]UKJ63188.1 zf-HC2 domain-containing protein [Cellulosimicrobium cellulans]